MTDTLRRQWLIWHVMLANYLLLLGAGHIAGLPRVTVLTLQPHVEAHLNVFSLLGHDIYFDLEFQRGAAKGNDDSLRTGELGGVRYNRAGAALMLPGQSVVIEAAIEGGESLLLTAMPANRANQFIIGRRLRADGIVPASLASNERDGASALRASPGMNHLTFRIVQVGGSLGGEDVELVALPPMRAAALQPGYGIFVGVFWLLPVAMIAFIGSGMLLLLLGTRRQGRDV